MKIFIKQHIKELSIFGFILLVLLVQKLAVMQPVFAQTLDYTNHSYHPNLGYYSVNSNSESPAQLSVNSRGQLAVTNGYNTVNFWDKSIPGAISPDLFGKPLYRKLSPVGDKRYWE